MLINQAREFFSEGVILEFSISRLKQSGWYLIMHGKNTAWTLNTSRGQIKYFSSLDTLYSEVENITNSLNAKVCFSHESSAETI